MGLVEHGLKAIVSFLEHEKKVYTQALMKSPEGGLIHEKRKGKQRYLQCIPCGKDAAGRRRYEQSDYRVEEKIHITSRGLAMRTRAEVLIAEALYRYDIPFRYEQVFPIGKYRFAPDFTFLDRSGDEFYLEYCGMMGDPEYENRHIWRRSMYENVGITEWNDMIYVYNEGDGIDMRVIEAIIKTRILPRVQGTAA